MKNCIRTFQCLFCAYAMFLHQAPGLVGYKVSLSVKFSNIWLNRWIAFEKEHFSGELYVLEKGLYGSPEDWGAHNFKILSHQHVVLVIIFYNICPICSMLQLHCYLIKPCWCLYSHGILYFIFLSQNQAEGLSRYKVSLLNMHKLLLFHMESAHAIHGNLNELIKYELIGADIKLLLASKKMIKLEYFLNEHAARCFVNDRHWHSVEFCGQNPGRPNLNYVKTLIF